MMLRIYLLIVFISLGMHGFAQDAGRTAEAPRKPTHGRTDAEKLVKQLIKGKSDEREKFDAIFFWVTEHIRYNYQEFYLPSAPIPGSIQRILSTRRTICLGYANLMDTLCKLAGIANVTVYGYARNELFDVQDTVYHHNHAWNAVRLNGKWYLYDATWSKGKVEYKPTRLSKWILRWLDTHPPKMKRKTLRNKWRLKAKLVCGTTAEPAYYYKPRFFNSLLRWRMATLPIRTRKVFRNYTSEDFYLSEPRLFSMTHVPDDPIWNLGDTRTFRQLETDSAWYHFNDSMLKVQQRQGFPCPECDHYAELNMKQRWAGISSRSIAFNPHNHFIVTLAEKQLGSINYAQATSERDSLARLLFLDSAFINFDHALQSLRQTKTDLKSYLVMQKNKNKRKMALLLAENKGYKQWMSHQLRLSLRQHRNYNILLSQENAYARPYLKKAVRTKRFKTNIKTDKLKPYPPQTVNAITRDLAKKEKQLDSLATAIRLGKQAYDSLLLGVSLNVWQHVRYHDSISVPFEKSIRWRLYFKDNYKKVIVELRKDIAEKSKHYTENLANTVYQPSEEAFTLFKQLTILIKAKTKLQNECLQYQRELLRAKAVSHAFLVTYKEDIIRDSEADFCWIAGHYPQLATSALGVYSLKEKQRGVIELLVRENDIERHRYSKLVRGVQSSCADAQRDLTREIRDVKTAKKTTTRYRKHLLNKKKR